MAEGHRKDDLTVWAGDLQRQFSDRRLGIDLDTARVWGELGARRATRGRLLEVSDGLIAATSIRHGLVILTRNIGDFKNTGA